MSTVYERSNHNNLLVQAVITRQKIVFLFMLLVILFPQRAVNWIRSKKPPDTELQENGDLKCRSAGEDSPSVMLLFVCVRVCLCVCVCVCVLLKKGFEMYTDM